jgi:hypothetical protein
LPDGFQPGARCRTLLLNAEDDAAGTILPRLRAAGADLDGVFVSADDLPKFPDDLPRLESLVREGDIGLLVIDPLSAFLPPDLAGGQAVAVRRVLAPLVSLAVRTGVAVVLVRHLAKRQFAKALYRGFGSIGIAGLARTVLLADSLPHPAWRRSLSVLKSNLTVAPARLAYRIIDRGGVGVVEWLDTADPPTLPARAQTPGVVRATVWLLEALAHGPRPAAELLVAAREAGIGERVMEHAKRQLKIASRVMRTADGRRFWQWCPPEEDDFSPLEPLKPYEMFAQPDELTDAGREVLERDQLAWASRVLRRRWGGAKSPPDSA